MFAATVRFVGRIKINAITNVLICSHINHNGFKNSYLHTYNFLFTVRLKIKYNLNCERFMEFHGPVRPNDKRTDCKTLFTNSVRDLIVLG